MNASERTREAAAVAGAPPSASALLQEAKSLWLECRGLVHDQLTLAALETRLAGKSLVTMIAAGLMVAVLLVSTWLGLVAAGVLWLVSLGVMASIAMLIAVAANLVVAAILYDVMLRQSRHLQFPATLRSLRPVPSELQTPEKR